MTPNGHLSVAVIGAGPVGLAAATHLVTRGETPLVLEAGARAGASVLEWGHVRIFSPWRYDVDTASTRLLEASGWTPPPADAHPTGPSWWGATSRPWRASPRSGRTSCWAPG